MPSAERWSSVGWLGQAVAGLMLTAFNITIAVTTYTKFIPLLAKANIKNQDANSTGDKPSFSASHYYVIYAYCIAFLPCLVAAYDLWVSTGCVYITARTWTAGNSQRAVDKFSGEQSTLARTLRSIRHIAWAHAAEASVVLFYVLYQTYAALGDGIIRLAGEAEQESWRLAYGASLGLNAANLVFLASTAWFVKIALHTNTSVWDIIRGVEPYGQD
ncbi:hypothetical protein Micbo1qcDRAFT_205610 [Microdochium bolleyi]|uniref:Uncharacterized protein n=1 Tax=Microdochium bolleyi TaxID=196109 RepID=A0A136IZK6_9PEZI|nr:hypothetical protein Micbo1qcDRAFT_205610 [Microdochium bolleyi]